MAHTHHVFRRLTQRLEVERDLAAFRRRYGFLKRCGGQRSSGRLLIVSLSDWVAQVKVELMLATALRLRDWQAVIMTWSSCRHAPRYFRSAGIGEFIWFDREVAQAEPDVAIGEARADELLRGARSIQDVLCLRERGVFVGRHVLSTLVRESLQGRLDLSEPATFSRVRQRVAASIQTAMTAERILERVNPDAVLFLEKGYSPFAEIYDVAVNRGLNVIHWQHAHRSDALALKRYTDANRHVHCFSVSEATWERARQMPWREQHERELNEELIGRYRSGSWFNRKFHHYNKRVKSPQEVRQQLGLDPAKKTAVIFSHVLWDATFFFGVNLFDDYEQWLIETVKAACENVQLNWVVKIHPDYVWKLKMLGGGQARDHLAVQANVGALPKHVTVLHPDTDLSTGSLFEVMDYCLTVRGTIGIEASCFGIPVLTAGTGRYAGLGFTIDSDSPAEYLQRLRHLHDVPRMSPQQTELARRHAYALLRLRPCPFTTFEVIQESLNRLGHPLGHNVAIRAHSLQQVQRAQDLQWFADWVGGSRAEDFCLPLPSGEADVAASLSSATIA